MITLQFHGKIGMLYRGMGSLVHFEVCGDDGKMDRPPLPKFDRTKPVRITIEQIEHQK